jgi:hypothetical protein
MRVDGFGSPLASVASRYNPPCAMKDNVVTTLGSGCMTWSPCSGMQQRVVAYVAPTWESSMLAWCPVVESAPGLAVMERTGAACALILMPLRLMRGGSHRRLWHWLRPFP